MLGAAAPFASIALARATSHTRRRNDANDGKQSAENKQQSYEIDGDDAADDEYSYFGERDTPQPPLRASDAGPQRPLVPALPLKIGCKRWLAFAHVCYVFYFNAFKSIRVQVNPVGV